MLDQALQFLLETVIGLLTFALLLRFYMQLLKTSFRNPVGEFVVALTDWLVRPARRVIPGLHGLDLASLIPAWAMQAPVSLRACWPVQKMCRRPAIQSRLTCLMDQERRAEECAILPVSGGHRRRDSAPRATGPAAKQRHPPIHRQRCRR